MEKTSAVQLLTKKEAVRFIGGIQRQEDFRIFNRKNPLKSELRYNRDSCCSGPDKHAVRTRKEVKKMDSSTEFPTRRGAIVALFLISFWCIITGWALSRNTESLHFIIKIGLIAILTHLYTGLFITAHDAMHGSLVPGNTQFNNLLGRLSLIFYGWLDFDYLKKQHQKHHEFPGTSSDPDFYTGSSMILWYIKFMRYYVTLKQICLMSLTFSLAVHLLSIPPERLLMFWALPSLLSSLQLFYFGTFRPHQSDANRPFIDDHNARSSTSRGLLYSFLTCYNFGAFHLEHHHYPWIPWWKLPTVPATPPSHLNKDRHVLP